MGLDASGRGWAVTTGEFSKYCPVPSYVSRHLKVKDSGLLKLELAAVFPEFPTVAASRD